MSNFIDAMFGEVAKKLQEGSRSTGVITPETVYQPANVANRRLVHTIVDKMVVPESRFENLTAFLQLAELSRQGKSCLILPEHYTNFDLPNLFLMLERSGPQAEAAANQIIAIAGVKLNEESLFVRAFSEAYSRIVTYPPRSIEALRQNPEANAEEISRARAINMAFLHQMIRLKHHSHMILVYPSGTRYRPGDESTRRGLKEMDSYIKSFDYLLFLGMAGNNLRINPSGEHMGEDIPTRDAIVFVASEVIPANEFRNSVRPSGAETDAKQAVADAVMAELENLHQKAVTIHRTIPGAILST